MIAQILHVFFTAYTGLLFARVVGSWFDPLRNNRLMQFVSHYTDPYLGLFRKLIPPIGGVLDLSPLLGFFALQIGENFLLSFFK